MNRAAILVPALLAAALTDAGIAAAELTSTTTINGSAPPGVMGPLTDRTVILDSVQQDGNRLLVQSGVRRPDTRTPIQYHRFPGRTCVQTGTMTHFVEGRQPATYPAGSCYEMPTEVAMSAANLGAEDVVLVDTFLAPAESAAIIVLEPGWPDLTDPTG